MSGRMLLPSSRQAEEILRPFLLQIDAGSSIGTNEPTGCRTIHESTGRHGQLVERARTPGIEHATNI